MDVYDFLQVLLTSFVHEPWSYLVDNLIDQRRLAVRRWTRNPAS